MADPTNVAGLDLNTLWTLIGGTIGTAVAAFGIRMGWKSGSKETSSPSDSVEIKSAIVDSSSVKVLAGSIEGLGFNLLELKKVAFDTEDRNTKLVEKLIESIDAQTNELRELGRELRDLAREVGKAK